MPIYLYKNLETGEIKEVVQKMDEEHIYIENGVMFERIFTVPGATIDSVYNINPNDPKEFVRKTAKKGKLKDIQELSAELSEKRASKLGRDPIKEKYFDKYAEARGGAVHPDKKKEQIKEFSRKNKHFEIEP